MAQIYESHLNHVFKPGTISEPMLRYNSNSRLDDQEHHTCKDEDKTAYGSHLLTTNARLYHRLLPVQLFLKAYKNALKSRHISYSPKSDNPSDSVLTTKTHSCFSVTDVVPGFDYAVQSRYTLYLQKGGVVHSARQNAEGEIVFLNLVEFLGENDVIIKINRDDNRFLLNLHFPKLSDIKVVCERFHLQHSTFKSLMRGDIEDRCDMFQDCIFLNIGTIDNMFSTNHPLSSHSRDSLCSDQQDTFDYSGKKIMCARILLVQNGMVILNNIKSELADTIYKKLALKVASKSNDNIHHWILYVFLRCIINEMQVFVSQIEDECDAIDNMFSLVNLEDTRKFINRIACVRTKLARTCDFASCKIELIRKMTHVYEVSQKTQETSRSQRKFEGFFEDLNDTLHLAKRHLETFKEFLDHLNETYYDYINIEISKRALETDNFLKKLSEIAIVLVPYSLITQIYSMNIPLPGTKDFFVNPVPFLLSIPIISLLIFASTKYLRSVAK